MSDANSVIVDSCEEVKFTQKDVERFWQNVNKNGPLPKHVPEIGNCWVWLLSKDRDGYGNFKLRGRMWRANRAAMLFKNGVEPSRFALHYCDNPACVRPDHLFEGTVQENAKDCVKKGRTATAENNGMNTMPQKRRKGTLNGNAKLDDDKVREIKQLYAAGGVTTTMLGARFGVSHAVIGYVVRGQRWTHVQPTPVELPA